MATATTARKKDSGCPAGGQVLMLRLLINAGLRVLLYSRRNGKRPDMTLDDFAPCDWPGYGPVPLAPGDWTVAESSKGEVSARPRHPALFSLQGRGDPSYVVMGWVLCHERTVVMWGDMPGREEWVLDRDNDGVSVTPTLVMPREQG